MPVSAATPAPTRSRRDRPLMDGTAWVGTDGLTFTDPEQLARVRRSELSISTSHQLTLDSCAVGMVASRLLPRDDDEFQENQLGTAAHGVLEVLFGIDAPGRTKAAADAIIRRLRQDRDFALTVLDADLVDRIHALNDVDLERWYFEVTRRVYGVWEVVDPNGVTVHATELGFGGKTGHKIMVGRVPFIGFIDRVDQISDDNGVVVGFAVLDYKFGKFKQPDRFGDDYGDQVKIYARAVETLTGKPVLRGDLLFATHGKNRTVPIDATEVDAAVEKFERAWDRMHELADANFYPAKTGPLCGWCPLVNVCPAAKRDGKTDLTDTEKVNGRRVKVEGKPLLGIPADKVHMPTVNAPITLATAAAHSANVTDTEGTPAMAITSAAPATAVLKEGTGPREDTADGALNGMSFAAIAVFGLTSLAVEKLSAAGQPVDGNSVRALAQTFAHITQNVEFALTGATRYGSGANTRIRGALRTAVDTLPAPWGRPADEWDAWAGTVTNRTKAIAVVSAELFNASTALPDTPWRALAS